MAIKSKPVVVAVITTLGGIAVGTGPHIPTMIESYRKSGEAQELGVSTDELAQAKLQLALFHKNVECMANAPIESEDLDRIRVEVKACQSRDLLLRWKPLLGQGYGKIHWVSFESVPDKAKAGVAHAAERRTAAARGKVKCQRRLSKTVVRIIKRFGNLCVLEEIRITTGEILKRRQVPCSARC